MNAYNSHLAKPPEIEEYHKLEKLLTRVVEEFSSLAGERSAQRERLEIGFVSRDSGEAKLTALAKRLYADRQKRQAFFPGLFEGEPAWDLLLDLFVARHLRQKVSVKSGCIASRAPATTALRYIQALEKEGYLEKESDPGDGRRVWIKLSEFGNLKVELYLRALLTGSHPLP